jgi:hypothetical protein
LNYIIELRLPLSPTLQIILQMFSYKVKFTKGAGDAFVEGSGHIIQKVLLTLG